ncbi:hypothetical protein [Nostoc sp. 'Peltigera malacea cyanobiont' DB3992]|uniref:hypothetical protein n=1 Tax=Nostoc sp. 'Peltigera malacea cyanobiont' DB3992 TaxID=1206980 RepID=UPI0015D47D43|nr:hypothetical protein [Nostoc sp. 'Peltigera malacea cyanobiont' DB3992]
MFENSLHCEFFIVVQSTEEEGYYFLNKNEFLPDLDDAQQFIRQEADKQAAYWNLYWQQNEHPPELTIINTFVTTPEQIQQTYQERERQWQLTVEEYNSQTNNAD